MGRIARQAGIGRRTGERHRELMAAVLMLLPMLVILAALRLLPLLGAVRASIQDPRLNATGTVGWDNYLRVLEDPTFVNTLKVTALFTLVVNPLQIAISLLLALLLARQVPLGGVWRTLIFLPAVVPQTVSAVIWGIALRSDGVFNGLLKAGSLPTQGFLTSPSQALWCIIVILTWIGVGYWMVILIAGLNDVPRELIEAAQVDGAGALQRFWHVTLPQLRRPLLFVLVADTVANFMVFAPVQILTKGGPSGSTNIVMFDIFQRAYITGDAPGASAATIMLVLAVVAIVGLQFRLLPESE